MLVALALLLAAPDSFPLELSVRAGYARSLGGEKDRFPVADLVPTLVPGGVDVRLRLGGPWSIMLGLEHAPSLGCTSPGCGGSVTRLAVSAHVQPATGSFRPFASLGSGYEWARQSSVVKLLVSTGEPDPGLVDTTFSQSASGIAWAVAQAGFEVELAPWLRLGPFAQLALGSFLRSERRLEGVPDSGLPTVNRDLQPLHGFAQAGVRVTVAP